MPIKTITFKDNGQDYIEWDIDYTGAIVGCRPFQHWYWSKCRVTNINELEVGGHVEILDPQGDQRRIYHPIERIN